MNNLYIAFIVAGFLSSRISDPQMKSYNRFQGLLTKTVPAPARTDEPRNRISRAVRILVQTPRFKTFQFSCVVINVLFLLADHADASENFSMIFDAQNLLFTYTLLGEV